MDALIGADAPSWSAPARLGSLRPGQRAVIVALGGNARGDETLAVRIAALGFNPGRTLRLIATAAFGAPPFAVEIGGRVFALGRREAGLVSVAPEHSAR